MSGSGRLGRMRGVLVSALVKGMSWFPWKTLILNHLYSWAHWKSWSKMKVALVLLLEPHQKSDSHEETTLNVVQQKHQQQKSLCKCCLSRHTEFNYSKNLIRLFLLFYYLFFPPFFFSFSTWLIVFGFFVALLFSLYSEPQTAPCPGDDKYF